MKLKSIKGEVDQPAMEKPNKQQKIKEEKKPRDTLKYIQGKEATQCKENKKEKTEKNTAHDANENLDSFSRAILASMEVKQRKPNLEKRRNSQKRPLMTYFKEQALDFENYLNGRKDRLKVASMTPRPVINDPIKNVQLKTFTPLQNPTKQHHIKTEDFEGKKYNTETLKKENDAALGNCTARESKPSPQQQPDIKIESQENAEVPSRKRRITVEQFLSRKRSHSSSSSGSESATKKRITIAEYNNRRNMA